MTDRERAILRELNKTRSVDYDGQTLEEVINQLSKSMGQTITLNKADLESVGASYETPVKLQMKNVATRSILKKILGELNLTYIMKDESIIVMTPERAKNTLTTRTYYVGDLITGPSESQPAAGVQPGRDDSAGQPARDHDPAVLRSQ